jgi:hypothetical protein
MELWIRSQHKGNLVIANSLEIEARNSGLYEIWNYTTNEHFSYLGTYKTKKRALEVLDEIQYELNKRNLGYPNYTGIYEMPKE